ncbi:MAG TPA: Crp/Fnr family transcriptional regulator [Candidatus Bathyarchaeia archaeon]|jgi:CRP-like cAMP-binding protein|nr:Crp/Fnr family transcriptional regulator [Candidatus Bathyarchaeia archaeon]
MHLRREQYAIVKASGLFQDLPRSASSHLLAAARARNFASRDIIFIEGDPAKEVFLLLSGRVKITKNSRNGEEVTLRLDSPGELIEELVFSPQGTRSSTAQAAHQSCSMLVWRLATFQAACEKSPPLQRNRQRILERRIRELEQRFLELSTVNVSPRVAQVLLRLRNQIGHKSNGQVQIDIQQQEVAQMTATTIYTVSRLLSDWEQQGLVSKRRGSIIVRDYIGMSQLCSTRKLN